MATLYGMRRKLSVPVGDLGCLLPVHHTLNAGPIWGFGGKELFVKNIDWKRVWHRDTEGRLWDNFEVMFDICRASELPLVSLAPYPAADWSCVAGSVLVEEQVGSTHTTDSGTWRDRPPLL